MRIQTFLSYCIGLIGLNTVIIIHELGHLLACKVFSVSAPVFSIGFGPQLFSFRLGQTLYQLSLLPIGGYVQINPFELAAQSYLVKMIISFAGIFFNIVFAYAIIQWFAHRNISWRSMLAQTASYWPAQRRLIGPIAIFSFISKSAALGMNYFLLVLAFISLNIGFFNLIPIPPFDGASMAYYTINALIGDVPERTTTIAQNISFALLFIAMLWMMIRDILHMRRS